jgi:hypothetical protein
MLKTEFPNKEDDDKSRPPKNRGEVYAQEQQRIAEETSKIPHQRRSLESIPGLMLLLE